MLWAIALPGHKKKARMKTVIEDTSEWKLELIIFLDTSPLLNFRIERM
jgi:hypothetical protein